MKIPDEDEVKGLKDMALISKETWLLLEDESWAIHNRHHRNRRIAVLAAVAAMTLASWGLFYIATRAVSAWIAPFL